MTQGNYPGQGQPACGQQPSFGQQPPSPYGSGGYIGPPAGSYGAANRQTFGIVGAIVAAIGVVLVVLAFTVFKWFRSDLHGNALKSDNDSTFGKIRDALNTSSDQLDKAPSKVQDEISYGIAHLYFGWLGWVLLAVAVVVTVVALLPSAAASAMRGVGLVVGLIAAGLTVWALDLISVSGAAAKQSGSHFPSFGDYLKHSGIGAWAAIAGFILLGVGAVIGPRRA